MASKIIVNGEKEDRRGRKLYKGFVVSINEHEFELVQDMFYIKKIKINNFRCFSSKKINLIPGTNVLIGENGCGKTSIAEAIGYVCLGKSFKGAKDKDVLLHNSAYFNIISEVDSGISTENVIISFDGKNKKVKIDENVCQTLSEYVGKYKLTCKTGECFVFAKVA